MDKTGVIYILTNPSFPEYVKIGYAQAAAAAQPERVYSLCLPGLRNL